MHITGRRLNLDVDLSAHSLSADINRALNPNCHLDIDKYVDVPYLTALVIIDEADRLRTNALEQLRDFFDRNEGGLILIGMPGFERQLARPTITGGNFGLIERLMTQIARVMTINQLHTMAPEAVHAARQMLIVRTQWDE